MNADRQILIGKTVLTTGASQGIGYFTALGLAKMGARLVLVGRSAERTQKAAAF